MTLISDTVDRGSNNCNSVAFGTSGKEFHFICYSCGKTGQKKSECRFRNNKNKPYEYNHFKNNQNQNGKMI